jgi:hypothetical protein
MMNQEIKGFIFKILLAALSMVVVAWIAFSYIFPGHYLPVLPWMLGFFTLVVIVTHSYQVKLSKKDMGKFTQSSMIMSMVRLVVYSIFAVVYLANNQENAAVFVVSLVFVYSIYTLIEITNLSQIVRRK